MNTSLRDLGERAGRVPVPQLDVAALVAAGESRIRRRRAAAVAVVAAVVVAVLSATVLLTPGRDRPRRRPPTTGRDAPDDGDTVETRPAARLLTYSVGTVIHWGDRTIDVGQVARGRQPTRTSLDYLDATDDGVVFITGPQPKRDESGEARHRVRRVGCLVHRRLRAGAHRHDGRQRRAGLRDRHLGLGLHARLEGTRRRDHRDAAERTRTGGRLRHGSDAGGRPLRGHGRLPPRPGVRRRRLLGPGRPLLRRDQLRLRAGDQLPTDCADHAPRHGVRPPVRVRAGTPTRRTGWPGPAC